MRIVVSWNELPVYGAKLINAGLSIPGITVHVVATKPTIPIFGMDEILEGKIIWIEKEQLVTWADLNLEIPDLFFQAGWYINSFMFLGKQVKDNQGKVILLSDNCWKNSLRQWIGSVYYRLKRNSNFDGAWVPGKSGLKFMLILGLKRNVIFTGLYGIDPIDFPQGLSLETRPKTFLFVGQLIERKGISQLIRVFCHFKRDHPDWNLIVIGDGPMRSTLDKVDGIILKSFAQPQEISNTMRNSRFLILPSLEDHWPLVVNEASLSGCGLILSNKIGNISEFIGSINGIVFDVKQDKELLTCMKTMASQSNYNLNQIWQESRFLGSRFTPKNWANQLESIIKNFNLKK
jgi:glycosyltransferase involved in cell wall biosynthesis